MTDLDTTELATGTARPVVPAGDDALREAWFREYARDALARAGVSLNPVEFNASVELNKFDYLYVGEYVVYVDTWLDDQIGGWLVRREVLFHSPDEQALQEFYRTHPDLDRRRSGSMFVDEPGTCYV